MSDDGSNVTPLRPKREPPRRPWAQTMASAISGLIGENVAARLAVPKAEIKELRGRIERLEKLTRHLDKPLHEVEP
jgi:hypothetical protein